MDKCMFCHNETAPGTKICIFCCINHGYNKDGEKLADKWAGVIFDDDGNMVGEIKK